MVIFHSYVSLPEGISFNYHMTVYVAGIAITVLASPFWLTVYEPGNILSDGST
jgi:hypothetical protein